MIVLFQPLITFVVVGFLVGNGLRFDRCLCRIRGNCLCVLIAWIFILPFLLVIFALWLAVMVTVGALAIVPFYFPAIYLNTRAYCRIMRYWSRRRRFATR